MWHATIVSTICFLNCTCDTTSNWVHLIKTEMIFFAIGQSQPGISYLHKKLLLSAGYLASTLKLKLWQRPSHYEYWTATQKRINPLNYNSGTLRFGTTFLGLERFYGHSNSKMSNQKTKHILFLLLRILDCKDKDEKWNSWILLHHL